MEKDQPTGKIHIFMRLRFKTFVSSLAITLTHGILDPELVVWVLQKLPKSRQNVVFSHNYGISISKSALTNFAKSLRIPGRDVKRPAVFPKIKTLKFSVLYSNGLRKHWRYLLEFLVQINARQSNCLQSKWCIVIENILWKRPRVRNTEAILFPAVLSQKLSK